MSILNKIVNFIFSINGAKSVGGIEIDCFLSENHSRKTSITRYPLENGEEVSDHIINEPPEITIKAFQSLSKFFDFSNIGFNRAVDCYEQLKALRLKRELVTIVTGLEVYDNMVIQDLTVDRDKDNTGGLSFTLTAKQANVVNMLTYQLANIIPKSQLAGDDYTKQQSQSGTSMGKQSSANQGYIDGAKYGSYITGGQ